LDRVALFLHIIGVDDYLALRKEASKTNKITGGTKAPEILKDKTKLLSHFSPHIYNIA